MPIVLRMQPGWTAVLLATGLDESGQPTVLDPPTWSADSDIVVIAPLGPDGLYCTVRAVGRGETDVTCRQGALLDTVKVHVAAAPHRLVLSIATLPGG